MQNYFPLCLAHRGFHIHSIQNLLLNHTLFFNFGRRKMVSWRVVLGLVCFGQVSLALTGSLGRSVDIAARVDRVYHRIRGEMKEKRMVELDARSKETGPSNSTTLVAPSNSTAPIATTGSNANSNSNSNTTSSTNTTTTTTSNSNSNTNSSTTAAFIPGNPNLPIYGSPPNASAPTEIFSHIFGKLETKHPITSPFDLASSDGFSSSQTQAVNAAIVSYINQSPSDAARFAFALVSGDLQHASDRLESDYQCGMITQDVWSTLGNAVNVTLSTCSF
jgi:hypothetical protein